MSESAPVDDVEKSKNIKTIIIQLLLGIVLVAVFYVIYTGLMLITPEFAKIHRNFDVELPRFTEYIYKNYMYYPIFYYLAKVTYSSYCLSLFFRSPSWKVFKRVTIFNILLCIVVVVVTITSIYYSTFTIGAAI